MTAVTFCFASAAKTQEYALYDALEAYDSGQIQETIDILEKLITGGDPSAMAMLAGLLINGQTGRPDLERAVQLYGQAARGGLSHSQALYGDYLFRGEGVQQNTTNGLCWLEKAADADHWWAGERLSEIAATGNTYQVASVCE